MGIRQAVRYLDAALLPRPSAGLLERSVTLYRYRHQTGCWPHHGLSSARKHIYT